MKTVDASWVVLVTLETPKYPSQLTDLIRLIRDSRKNIKVHGYIQKTWEWRLRRLQPLDGSYAGRSRSLDSPTVGRHRRGLFNLVGMGLHALFGVATDQQVSQYRQATRTLAAKTQDLTHLTTEMMTLVNQNRLYLRNHSVALSQMRDHVRQLDTYVSEIASGLKRVDFRLTQLEIRLEVDRAVEECEYLYEAYREQMRLYQQQRGCPGERRPNGRRTMACDLEEHSQ